MLVSFLIEFPLFVTDKKMRFREVQSFTHVTKLVVLDQVLTWLCFSPKYVFLLCLFTGLFISSLIYPFLHPAIHSNNMSDDSRVR